MNTAHNFRSLCQEAGLPVTHQRQVIYETLVEMPGHPSPESLYEQVRVVLPSISLATVYKNLHLFIQKGIVKEMSMHHGAMRLEPNAEPHNHLVCRACKHVWDIEYRSVNLEKSRGVPAGFKAERYAVDIIGVCEACQEYGRA